MALSPVDRDANYMKEKWGTSRLITDYISEPQKKVLQEIMYDPALVNKKTKQELFEMSDKEELTYGIEPNYKIQSNQKLINE